MVDEIQPELFFCFLLSSLQQIIKDNPDSSNEEAYKFGEDTGIRLKDDFFAKMELFNKLENKDIEKYIIKFFKHYFNVKSVVENKKVSVEKISKLFDFPCVKYFFMGVLNSVFQPLNINISFKITEDGTLFYEFN